MNNTSISQCTFALRRSRPGPCAEASTGMNCARNFSMTIPFRRSLVRRSSLDHAERLPQPSQLFGATPEAPEHGHESDLHEADHAEKKDDGVIRALGHR